MRVMDRIRASSVGLILLVIGAVLILLNAIGWANTSAVDLFKLGVGLAFLGIVLG